MSTSLKSNQIIVRTKLLLRLNSGIPNKGREITFSVQQQRRAHCARIPHHALFPLPETIKNSFLENSVISLYGQLYF